MSNASAAIADGEFPTNSAISFIRRFNQGSTRIARGSFCSRLSRSRADLDIDFRSCSAVFPSPNNFVAVLTNRILFVYNLYS
jgi:hypothetical protein